MKSVGDAPGRVAPVLPTKRGTLDQCSRSAVPVRSRGRINARIGKVRAVPASAGQQAGTSRREEPKPGM
jgi:hypothetical protein